MTSLGPGPVTLLTPVVHGEAVITTALHRAIRRDLARLTQVLQAPVAAVRRAALIDHTSYVLDQLQTHHKALDAISWPAVVVRRPELEDVASRVLLAHGEMTAPIAAVRHASLVWRADPGKRRNLLTVVRELLVVLSPVLEQDSELAPVIDDTLRAEPLAARPARAWFAAPTRVARRTFWLLDDLEPVHATALAERTPRAVMWILRNGFSGAYNRGAYLMWVGGGSGPAI